MPALAQAKAFAGTLGQSAAQLAKALALQAAQEKTLMRLFAYANLAADQDTRVASYQGMNDEMTQVAAQFGAVWAFVEPELLALDPKTWSRGWPPRPT
jgi:oligoendopeptidase F